MGFLDFLRGNKEVRSNVPAEPQNQPALPAEPSALSAVFRDLMQQGSATSLSAFFSATELISNAVAQLPILVKRDNVIDKNHNINFLFKDCTVTKFVLFKQMVRDVIMFGNAYAYIDRADNGTPINIVYCDNGSVTVAWNKYKQELYYQIPMVGKKKIEPINVIHLYKNSNDGINGIPLVNYANSVIRLAQATDKTASNYYASGCALQGALTIKGARKGAKEQARQAFMETHNGKNSGLVILDDDMTYQSLSSNANESQMVESRTFNVAEIARFFNINPILLGENSGSSFSSIEAANIEFVTHTIQPYVTMIEEELNRKLIKPSEQGHILIDLDEKYLMKGDMATTADYLSKLTNAGIMSINEARDYLGLNPVDGGDECQIPYTKIQDNKINDNNDNGDEGIQ